MPGTIQLWLQTFSLWIIGGLVILALVIYGIEEFRLSRTHSQLSKCETQTIQLQSQVDQANLRVKVLEAETKAQTERIAKAQGEAKKNRPIAQKKAKVLRDAKLADQECNALAQLIDLQIGNR